MPTKAELAAENARLRSEVERLRPAPFKRGYRNMVGQTWTGVIYDTSTGAEVAECHHRHFVSTEEAMSCPALDEPLAALLDGGEGG
jgi:hypothetical protein